MKTITDQLAETIQKVEDGNFNPLEAYANLDMLEKFTQKCKEQIFESALEEHGKYGENTINAFDFEITLRNGSITYDYSGHKELNELKDKAKIIIDNLKIASKKNMIIVDPETGESFEPCPIKSGSKQSLIIK